MPKNKNKDKMGYNMGGMGMGAVGSDKYMKKTKTMKKGSYSNGGTKTYPGFPYSPSKKS